jgi:hypothetical protein
LAAPRVKTLPQFEKLHEEQVDQMASAKFQMLAEGGWAA